MEQQYANHRSSILAMARTSSTYEGATVLDSSMKLRVIRICFYRGPKRRKRVYELDRFDAHYGGPNAKHNFWTRLRLIGPRSWANMLVSLREPSKGCAVYSNQCTELP